MVHRFLLASSILLVSPHAFARAEFHVTTLKNIALGDAKECPIAAAIANINSNGLQGMVPGTTNANCPAGQADNVIYFDKLPKYANGNAYPIALSAPLTISKNKVRIEFATFDGQQQTHHFTISGSADVTFHHVELMNGSGGSGGSISVYDDANLTLENKVKLWSNVANGDGGAVSFASDGELRISNSLFSGNEAHGSGYGGALVISGQPALIDVRESSFSVNEADRGGGAIACKSPSDDLAQVEAKFTALKIEDNVVHGVPIGTGGGLLNGCRASVSLTLFRKNVVRNGPGGAIYNETDKRLRVSDSFFDDNVAGSENAGDGGGIYDDGWLDVRRSSFHRNRAFGNGGGIAFATDTAGNRAWVSNTSFIRNEAIAFEGDPEEGAALWFDDADYPPGDPDPLYLEPDYLARVFNNTFVANEGASQLYFARTGTVGDIAFINNLVQGSERVPNCAGDVDRLALRRVQEPRVYNAQYPGTSCDNGSGAIPVADAKLTTTDYGGWHAQAYRTSQSAKKLFGDNATCLFEPVEMEDQHEQARACLLGAIENPVTSKFPPGYPK